MYIVETDLVLKKRNSLSVARQNEFFPSSGTLCTVKIHIFFFNNHFYNSIVSACAGLTLLAEKSERWNYYYFFFQLNCFSIIFGGPVNRFRTHTLLYVKSEIRLDGQRIPYRNPLNPYKKTKS